MTGKQLQEFLKKHIEKSRESGDSTNLTEIAQGLGMIPQTLNTKFKSKSLKSDFLKQIADVLKINVSEMTGYSLPTPSITTTEDEAKPYGKTLQDRLVTCLDSKEALYKKIGELHERLHKAEQELIQQQRKYTVEKIK